MEPFSAGMFASIGAAFKFADIAVRIAEVGSENAVFVRAIRAVRSDLEEVERLLSLQSVKKRLNGTPGKLPWIKNSIQNTRCALNEIGKWVERARVEQETTGTIKFDTRVRWVFSDHEKLLNRKAELSTCHQQLSNVLGYLIGLEDVPSRPVSLEYRDASCADNHLSRPWGYSGPEAMKTECDRSRSSQNTGLPDRFTARSDVAFYSQPSCVPGASNSGRLPVATEHIFSTGGSNPSLPSTVSPPSSPPPTYAAAVSIDPNIHSVLPEPRAQTAIDGTFSVNQFADHKTVPGYTFDNTWAYRSNFDGSSIPELAGDTVVLSATNSAGPVNPFELTTCVGRVTPHRGPRGQTRHEELAEMMGDLHFPIELPNNKANPPPGHPTQNWAKGDQLTLAQSQAISTTPYTLRRRPVPVHALSDSLLAFNEMPAAPVTRNMVFPQPASNIMLNTDYCAVELPAENMRQSHVSQSPSSYNVQQTERISMNLDSASNRRSSVPLRPSLGHNMYAASFSADSTSSWGLDTQPKATNRPRAQGAATGARMQSQKQIMDLLGSIGN